MLTAAPCKRLIWRWPQTTALANYPERMQPTIKQHRRTVFNWIKITSRVITACWRMLNFAECFHAINANKTFFFLTLTSWQGASPAGRGDVWQGSLVILIFQVWKPPLIVMLCRIPPPPPSLSAMFVFAGAVLSKANCFTAPPSAPREDFTPIWKIKKFKPQSLICDMFHSRPE